MTIRSLFKRGLRLGWFFLFYLKELVLANFKVAHDVLTPRLYMKPGIVAVPLDLEKEVSLVGLANLITMTPGSLSIDISTDRKCLYIHTLFLEDPDRFREKIKHDFERRIREVFE